MPRVRSPIDTVCKSLANGLRRDVLRTLGDGEKNVTEIFKILGKSQSNISHQMRRLENDGMVIRRRKDKFHYYSVAPNAKAILDLFEAHLQGNHEALAKTRDSLLESEARFRTAAFISSDLIHEWDTDTDQHRWFGNIASSLGGKAEDAPKTTQEWAERIHADDRERVVQAAKRAVEDGKPFSETYRFSKQDGTYALWVARAALQDEISRKRFRLISAVKAG